MGTIFALRSRYLTLKNHISGYEKVLDFWKTDLLYWGHTVTFRPQLKKIWDYDFFAWYLHLQIYSKTFRQSVLRSSSFRTHQIQKTCGYLRILLPVSINAVYWAITKSSSSSSAKKKYNTFFQGRLGSKNKDLETILHTQFDL